MLRFIRESISGPDLPADAYHTFRIKNRHFLLDIENSFLYSISPAAYSAIAGDPRNTTDAKNSLAGNICARLEWNRIKKTIHRLSEGELEQEKRRLEQSRPSLAGLWLGVSHVCNLACEYCFANEPAYLGKNRLMDKETALKGVDYLIEHSQDRSRLEIVFFGGEPLLNMPVIDAVVAYCRQKESQIGKSFSFSMTTNGTLLTADIFQKLDAYGIYPMISMDGTPEIHNRFRKTKAGLPSWDLIVDNLRAIPEFWNYFSVRATIVEEDTDLVACLRGLQELGFKDIRLAGVCPNAGVSPEKRVPDLEVWKKRYTELLDHAVAVSKSVEDIPEVGLRRNVEFLKDRHRSYFCCGTGRYYYYLDPEGDLYPCFRLMTPDARERLGSLDTPIDENKIRELLKSNVFSTSCNSCWARYLCGGPCFGDTYFSSGDFSTPNPIECEQRKFSLYCAAYLLDHLNPRN